MHKAALAIHAPDLLAADLAVGRNGEAVAIDDKVGAS